VCIVHEYNGNMIIVSLYVVVVVVVVDLDVKCTSRIYADKEIYISIRTYARVCRTR
jgi:hypothetical protein